MCIRDRWGTGMKMGVTLELSRNRGEKFFTDTSSFTLPNFVDKNYLSRGMIQSWVSYNELKEEIESINYVR